MFIALQPNPSLLRSFFHFGRKRCFREFVVRIGESVDQNRKAAGSPYRLFIMLGAGRHGK